ncbi:MAG TPA: hypothetical protein VMU50_15870, partial [Polyangia bacterium]|nr:hypothetical protein [Polyangia bacterium]
MRIRRRRWRLIRAPAGLLGAVAAVMAAGGAAAGADPDRDVAPELSLTWQAPAGCPDGGDVEAQFARLLGGAGRAPAAKHLTATATVQPAAAGRWTLRLETALDGVPGQRALEGDSCWTVASAAALILALTIDPNATAAPEPAREEPGARAAPMVAIAPPPPPEPAPRWRLRPFARAFGSATLALLPSPALGG